jgi:hypothetical protein
MTNVPGVTFGANGFQAPATSAVLEGVIADYQAAFGGKLNLSIDNLASLATPQGQLSTSTTALITQANNAFLLQAMQTDPAYAFGRWQDAIGRIFGQTRDPAQPTVLQIKCIGAQGVVIPVNALISDISGNVYACSQAGTISGDGTVTLPFACSITGPIAVPSANQVAIYQAIPGWDSATCVSGVIGRNVESRAQYEARRQATLAANSRGSAQAVLGAVLKVAGVLDAFVYQNDTDAPAVYRGVSLSANSIYVAAVGGDHDAIAQAIWSKKAPGCAYNGDTIITVYDDSAQYSPPFPSYEVKFQIAAALPVCFVVNIKSTPLTPSTALAQIQDAIISAFAGGDGGPIARIGSVLYANRFVPPIAALGPWAQIVSIGLGSLNLAAARGIGSIAGNVLTVTALSFGTIEVGQFVFGHNGDTASGTVVTGFLSGTGGLGTYRVNIAQTIPSEGADFIAADQNLVVVNIDQSPTATPGNIALVLS